VIRSWENLDPATTGWNRRMICGGELASIAAIDRDDERRMDIFSHHATERVQFFPRVDEAEAIRRLGSTQFEGGSPIRETS
jgi:hypothetical protein